MIAQHRFAKVFPSAPLMRMFPDDMTNGEVAERLGVTRNFVLRMRKPGHTINWLTADKLAIHLGFHPVYIWGDLWVGEVSTVNETDNNTSFRVTDPDTEDLCQSHTPKSHSHSAK